MPVEQCQFVKVDTERCRRHVATGQRFCWQHAHGLRARWRSLTRNQTIVFWLTVAGIVITSWFGVQNLLTTPPLITIFHSNNQTTIETKQQELAPAKANKAIPETAPPKDRASSSDNVTEGVWFGVQMEASHSVRDEFWALDPKYLNLYRRSGSVNTIDRWSSEFYDTAWKSTFAKFLLCGQHDIVGSSMSFVASEHPLMEVSVANNAAPGSICEMRATVYVPHTGAGGIFTGSGAWPRHQYIFDLPIWGAKNVFGLRFHMGSGEIRELNQGFLPSWKSFAIDNAGEKIELHVNRKGADWIPISRLDECLPKKILLRTGLESEGPWIVREYELTSHIPRQIGRGDDTSRIFIWAFTWRRTGYAEQPNQFAGIDGIPPTLLVQDVRK